MLINRVSLLPQGGKPFKLTRCHGKSLIRPSHHSFDKKKDTSGLLISVSFKVFNVLTFTLISVLLFPPSYGCTNFSPTSFYMTTFHINSSFALLVLKRISVAFLTGSRPTDMAKRKKTWLRSSKLLFQACSVASFRCCSFCVFFFPISKTLLR